ncbi:MAG: hypothetical protein ACI9D5_002382 [Candidatus Endobugula sp.]|jgi:hypothetical protein
MWVKPDFPSILAQDSWHFLRYVKEPCNFLSYIVIEEKYFVSLDSFGMLQVLLFSQD